jgi:predicted RNA-binding protein with PIN domain
MSLVIDGYNLAYEVGWLTRRQRGSGALERARERLLNFIVHSLDEKQASRTTVVFDAKKLPPGVSAEQQRSGIKILFAENYDDADAMIEELIEHCGAPKALTVVSSDRRIMAAAKRRRATPLRSGEWYELMLQARTKQVSEPHTAEEFAKKSATEIPSAELDYWLRKFS